MNLEFPPLVTSVVCDEFLCRFYILLIKIYKFFSVR